MSEPTVNWPEKSGLYVVVQLELDGEPYLRFPTNEEESFHPVILGIFLDRHGIRHATPPALEVGRYRVPGMGLANVDAEQRSASFFGNSITYRIGIDRKHLERIRELQREWVIDLDSR